MSSKEYKENYNLIDWSVPLESPKKARPDYSMRSHLAAPMVVGDYAPYECPVTGKMIEGRYAHTENLKNTGCRILEKGEREDKKKNALNSVLEKMDATIDKCVDEVAAQI
jgi:hypothetical protein